MAAAPLSWAVMFSLMMFGPMVTSLPLSLPPLPPDPVIVRAAPEECLFYLSWNGMAKPDPKSANQTEQLLAEAEIQKFGSNVMGTIDAALDEAFKEDTEASAARARIVPLVKVLLRRPMAFYVSKLTIPGSPNDRDEFPLEAGFIVNLGDELAAVRPVVQEFVEQVRQQQRVRIAEQTVGGVRFSRMSEDKHEQFVSWAFKDSYFLFGLGQGSAATLAARLDAKAKPATWLARIRAKLPVERPATTGYVNVPALMKLLTKNVPDPQFAAAVRAIGLDNVRSVAMATGLDKQGILSQTLLEIDGEPRGIFSQLHARPLAAADLAPIPKDAVMAGAIRLDLATLDDQVRQIVQEVDPAAHDAVLQHLAQMEQQLGFKRDDLFKGLGDAWCFYSAATPGALMGGTAAVVVSVRDKAAVQRAHDALLNLAQQALAAQEKPPIEIKVESVGQQQFHYVQIKQPFAPVSPAWCLTDKALVISTTPDGVKHFLTVKGQGGSLADLPEVAGLLRSDRGSLAVGYLDTASVLKTGYPALQLGLMMAGAQLQQTGSRVSLPPLPALDSIVPHARPAISVASRTKDGLLIQHRSTIPLASVENLSGSPAVMVALLLPAIQAVREAARRNSVSNKMHNLGIAFQNVAGIKKGEQFPAAASYDKEGKALLSWRVHILPYIEEKALYDQFRLNEPWDSEHNKKLIAKMPELYASPNDPDLAKQGKTRFLLPTGKSALFSGKEGPSMRSITDGTANTIMLVEAHPDKAVEWTKPEDLEIDPAQPLKGLQGARANGFQALFADASVDLINDTIDLVVLRALFTPRGNEAVQRP